MKSAGMNSRPAGDPRVAVLSDVHGNTWALQRVLADVARRGIKRVLNLGDSLYGPLDPAGTAKMLIDLGAITVRGNEDRLITEANPNRPVSPTLAYNLECLSADALHWLESLPLTAVAFRDLYLCHGTPDRDDVYLLKTVSASAVEPRSPDELESILASISKPVVLCGHDHVPCTLRLPSGRLIVNPGSIGLQAYTDDLPYPHAMQSGSPHARYAILHPSGDGWESETVTVAYDWDAAAHQADSNGRPDWAAWLRTGLADR